jgi:hypothetical protein
VHRSKPRPSSLLLRCHLCLSLSAVLICSGMIFIASYLSMMSFWLGMTPSNVVLCGRMFRTALISLPTIWTFGSEPSYGLFLSRILATVITGSVMSGRSMVPAMFTVSSRYYWHYLSTSLQPITRTLCLVLGWEDYGLESKSFSSSRCSEPSISSVCRCGKFWGPVYCFSEPLTDAFGLSPRDLSSGQKGTR